MGIGFATIESWASRFGYVVERTEGGYVWHLENDPQVRFAATAREVLDAILGALRDEYEGGE